MSSGPQSNRRPTSRAPGMNGECEYCLAEVGISPLEEAGVFPCDELDLARVKGELFIHLILHGRREKTGVIRFSLRVEPGYLVELCHPIYGDPRRIVRVQTSEPCVRIASPMLPPTWVTDERLRRRFQVVIGTVDAGSRTQDDRRISRVLRVGQHLVCGDESGHRRTTTGLPIAHMHTSVPVR